MLSGAEIEPRRALGFALYFRTENLFGCDGLARAQKRDARPEARIRLRDQFFL